MKISVIFKKFFGILFSNKHKCIGCNAEMFEETNYMLCENCIKEIKQINPCCLKCGDVVAGENQYCLNCKSVEREFDFSRSAVIYDGVIKNLIYKFKYGNAQYLKEFLAKFLYDLYLTLDIKVDYVVSVPICKKRLKERGYNQAKLLAQEFCKLTNLPYLDDVLIRIKETTAQAEMNFKERKVNMQGAFEVVNKEIIKNKNILIIDDIFTTGATICECAKTLKHAKASHVFGLTVAHTQKNIKFEI